MRLLFPTVSVLFLLASLIQLKLENLPFNLRAYSYKAIYFLCACITETELLLQLNLHIFVTMTENSIAPSSWEKLVPDKSDQSAAMRFHLV
jgi:hypothetical protein